MRFFGEICLNYFVFLRLPDSAIFMYLCVRIFGFFTTDLGKFFGIFSLNCEVQDVMIIYTVHVNQAGGNYNEI